MATPLWCWLAFAFRLYAPTSLGRLIPNVLFAASCTLAWPNLGRDRARPILLPAGGALARDIRSGEPAYRIVRRHTPFLHPSQDEATRLLPMLDARDRAVRSHDPPFRESRLPSSRLRLPGTMEGTTAHVTGVDPQITFNLPGPRPVAGIRIKYAHVNRQGAPAASSSPGSIPTSPATPTIGDANWALPTGERHETTSDR